MKYLSEMSVERLAFLIGSVILLVAILSVTSCTMTANSKAADLLKNGVSAVEIHCAITVGQDMSEACAKAALK